jgi:CheY-like chemotaxis protein
MRRAILTSPAPRDEPARGCLTVRRLERSDVRFLLARRLNRHKLVSMSDGPARGASVLVIDDDLDIRQVLAEVLTDAGYDVDCAQDGGEAVAKLRAGARPSVILLDLWMPGVNGFGFRSAQLASAETAGIPVVVVTAGGVAPREMAVLGLAYVLHKPVDLEVLLRVVRRLSSPGRHAAPAPMSEGHAAGTGGSEDARLHGT